MRRRYVDHLQRHPDGWARSCAVAHLTASSLITDAAEQQVLLTLHARLGRWLQTGGHLEPADASLADAARREAVEESGLASLELDPDPVLLSEHEVPCGPVQPCFHLDVQYLVLADCASAPVVSPESLSVEWFPVHRLPDVDASVHALVAAAARRLRW